jgi:hypothetical protein
VLVAAITIDNILCGWVEAVARYAVNTGVAASPHQFGDAAQVLEQGIIADADSIDRSGQVSQPVHVG